MSTIEQSTSLVGSGHDLARITELAVRDFRELVWGDYELFWGDYRLAWGEAPLLEQPTTLISSGLSFTRATSLT